MLAVAAAQAGEFFLFSGVDLVDHGGEKPEREYLRDAYCYNPKSGWRRVADVPRAGGGGAHARDPLGPVARGHRRRGQRP